MLRSYYRLTKPGIIYGNALTAAAGYLFAARWSVYVPHMLGTLIGISLVIAAACVINNLLDRSIDEKMDRTRGRGLVTGAIDPVAAGMYAAILGGLGFWALGYWTNRVVVIIGIVAFVDYVVAYGWAKRHSVHSTLIGSVSGSAPIVAGYCAVTGRFDGAALLLGIIMACWQMAHFFGIALYRRSDYAHAGLPIISVVRGGAVTKRQTIIYIALFIIACASLTLRGYASHGFLIVMLISGLVWLWRALVRWHSRSDTAWGRGVFLDSLVVTLIFSVAIATGSV